MNNALAQETALLRAELAKLLTTLKHNREQVSLDVLKTKYKKGYDTLCAGGCFYIPEFLFIARFIIVELS